MLIHRFPDDTTVYIAIDETIEPNDQCQFEDFLHTLHPANLPPYRLTLKKNCPVILLRNLNPTEGLCNGTRLICHDFKLHVISATISSGDFKNKHLSIQNVPGQLVEFQMFILTNLNPNIAGTTYSIKANC
ncbi:hypothetical protein H5410_043344 [Solanum commersonii]|uniref:DNA helicase Pif1-like 2B domain-containing protein n=1 Tax=Solanum commersonii TaxID=4109 RepID=A0A9J5Y151_SOLCO|nr:hypothetical protein H5410_043344 [Solanum commersonii]